MTENANHTAPLIVGIDWADAKHDLTIMDGSKRSHFGIKSDTEDVAEMIDRLTQIAAGRPIAVCLEKGRVRIIYHLMLHENITLYLGVPKLFQTNVPRVRRLRQEALRLESCLLPASACWWDGPIMQPCASWPVAGNASC